MCSHNGIIGSPFFCLLLWFIGCAIRTFTQQQEARGCNGNYRSTEGFLKTTKNKLPNENVRVLVNWTCWYSDFCCCRCCCSWMSIDWAIRNETWARFRCQIFVFLERGGWQRSLLLARSFLLGGIFIHLCIGHACVRTCLCWQQICCCCCCCCCTRCECHWMCNRDGRDESHRHLHLRVHVKWFICDACFNADCWIYIFIMHQ